MPSKKKFEELLPLLKSVAQGIACQFGSNCEVAVHNLTGGVANTIAAIENGHVTGRKVGDSASEVVLQALKDRNAKDRFSYFANATNGKMLKCSTIYVHDDDGEVVALLCINYDISDFTMASRSLAEFLPTAVDTPSVESIPQNVNELLDQLIEESHRYIGKPISVMTKEDKQDAIAFLDQKGALLIKKSSERISDYYGISKYTLYNYLGNSADK